MIPFILTMAAKASIIFGAAFVVTLLMRRASAAARHVVWLAAFGAALALPVAAALLPRMGVPMLAAGSETAGGSREIAVAQLQAELAQLDAARAAQDAGIAAAHAALASEAAKHAADEARIHAQLDRAHAFEDVPVARDQAGFWGAGQTAPWASRVFMLWLFGFVMVAVAFAVGVLRTHVLACQAAPAGVLLGEEAEVLAAGLGIARDVRVVTWDGPAMPMTWGAIRPVVLLPHAAHEWPAMRRREVLTHELAHVERGDYAARLLAALVCAIHWFNPLAWMAARRLRDEQELACDDVVLAGGAEPSDYAAHLLAVARSFRVPSLAVGNATVAMARPSQLSDRLLAMLDGSRRHAPAPRTMRLAWVFALLFTLPLAAAVPVQRHSAEAPKPPKAPRAVGAAPAAPAAVATAATPAVAPVAPEGPVGAGPASPSMVALPALAVERGQERCPQRRGRSTSTNSHSSSSHDDGRPDTHMLTLREGGCTLEVRIAGQVRFNEDDTDVAQLGQGAWVRVSEEDRSLERRFDMQWRDGQIVRRFRVDGEDVAETPELRQWLGEALQTAFTRTGYNVVPRTMRAYRAGGLDSVLALAGTSSSDYTRRRVVTVLIDSVRLSARDAARIAGTTDRMSSDYEKAELLIAIARRLPIDGAVQEALVRGAGAMSSDYERRRVLTVALGKGDLSAQATEALLAVAARMSSDYEKVELLLTYVGSQPFSADRRANLFNAANSISSDYERRRLLTAVVNNMESLAIIGEVTASAARMSSDYEKAELLVQIMRRFGNNASARSGVLRATESMSSDHEKNRVLALLARQ